MHYLAPIWTRPLLQQRILISIERLEVDGSRVPYAEIRRAVARLTRGQPAPMKSVIIQAAQLLVNDGYLAAEDDAWESTSEWRYWRERHRNSRPGGNLDDD